MGNPSLTLIHAIAALLILLQLSTLMYPSAASKGSFHSRRSHSNANKAYIKASCRLTTYPKLCIKSLSRHATQIKADPKLLAHAALNASLSAAQTVSRLMKQASRTHSLDPKQAAALQNCVADVQDLVKKLQKSVREMESGEARQLGSSDDGVRVRLSDVQTRVRIALEKDRDLCLHVFPVKGLKGKLKTWVRKRIIQVAHLTSNALALVRSSSSLSETKLMSSGYISSSQKINTAQNNRVSEF